MVIEVVVGSFSLPDHRAKQILILGTHLGCFSLQQQQNLPSDTTIPIQYLVWYYIL
jgi:hypothetical protein